MSRLTPVSLLLLFLTVGLAAGALVPRIALAPLAGYLSQSRTPEATLQAARATLAAAALVCAALAAARRPVRRSAVAFIGWIAALPSRRYWATVLGVGALLRLAVCVALPYRPVADAWWYHETATSLALGLGFRFEGQPTAYRPPGYPLLLSLTYRLFGPDVRLAWIWGGLAALILVVALDRTARLLYGERAARLAVLAAAIYPALVLETGAAMSDLPFAAGLLLLVLFVVRRPEFRLRNALLAGVGVGLLTLVRGVGLGLCVALPSLALLRRGKRRFGALLLAATALSAALTLLPWIVRNQRVLGCPTLGTNLGINLYVGNHAGASGGFDLRGMAPLSPRGAAGEVSADRELRRRAEAFLERHPEQAALLAPGKLFHLYALETSAVTEHFQGDPSGRAGLKYALDAVAQLAYLLIGSLFLARLPDLVRPGRRPCGAQWTGWILIGYFTAMSLVFFGQDRFRLPILPWMLLEGSVALLGLVGLSPSDPLPAPDMEGRVVDELAG